MTVREARKSALVKNGIPEDLSPELTNRFMTATLIVSRATDFAISKALISDRKLIERFRSGDTDKSRRVELSRYDVEQLTHRALSRMPECIKNRAEYEEDSNLVRNDAIAIFESYGFEKQIEKIKSRMPKVLRAACVMPEPEI